MRTALTVLVAGTVLASPACAPGPTARAAGRWQTLAGEQRTAAAADSLVGKTLEEQHLLAISVAIVQDSGIVYSHVAGEAAPGTAADTGTVFRAASLGKPVFAYLLLRLADQGLIALDSPVVNYLPRPLATYEHYAGLAADPRHRALTARRILSQQSGLPNWNREGPVPLLAEPGTVFWYSGEGYVLLQRVLEELTGRTVNDLAREQVFGPLGMTNSSYLWERRFDGRFSADTLITRHPILLQSRERAEVAGSLLTTATDYARFLLAVLGGRGLSEASFAVLLAPQAAITSRSLFSLPSTDTAETAKALGLAWTAGWGRMETSRGPALFHVGREDGCENYAVAFLERGTALVVLSATPVGHQGTFTAPLLEALIGDGSQPLEWLEYR